MRRFIGLGLVVSLHVLPFAGAVRAESVRVEADAKVSAPFPVTYGDLAKAFLPDIAGDGSAADKTPGKGVRHVGGEDMRASTEVTVPESIERLEFEGEAGKRALILFTFGTADGAVQSVSILGIYDVSAEPRLLDAADVGFDRFTSFIEPEIVMPSPEAPVALLQSSHFNAGEAFVQTSLVSLAGDKVGLVDTIGTMNWNGCAWSIFSDLGFRATKGTIRATITVRKTKLDGGGCDPDRNERRIKAGRLDGTYVWESGRKSFKKRTAAFKTIPFPSGAE